MTDEGDARGRRTDERRGVDYRSRRVMTASGDVEKRSSSSTRKNASTRRAPITSDSEHSQSPDASQFRRAGWPRASGAGAQRSARCGVDARSRAREVTARRTRAGPRRVPSGGAFGGESALVPCPRGHPTSRPSCRSVPRAGEGPSPAPTLTPPRCPWWPNRTPRTRLARPTRPACSRWWRLEPRSRARRRVPRISSLTPPSPRAVLV